MSCENNYNLFIQVSPRYFCKSLKVRLAAKEKLGLDYLPKCRDPRCSQECQANWASKQSACRTRLLRDLPADFDTFRGNLTLPPDATPDDHRKVKKVFIQALRRWKKRAGITLEIHSFLHATDPRNAHWDFVGYTSGRRKAAMGIIRDLWTRSGGLRASCVEMSEDEFGAVNRYQTHAAPISKRKLSVSRDPIFVFLPRAEMGGLEITWHTAGFWMGSSLEATWRLLISEWFGDDGDDLDEQFEIVKRRTERHANGDDRPSAPISKRELSVTDSVYIPGDDVSLDRIHFPRRLPRNPDDAIGVEEYSSQWGVSPDYLLSVLRSCPNAQCLNGYPDPVSGHLRYNVWHRKS